MPFLEIDGTRLHYTDEGSGEQTIVFSHGLLMNGAMFADQVANLKSRYRCITYDHRGQGKSQVTDDGYDMETLAGDAARLIEALDAAPCHFAGLSMGGFIGMRLAIERPELLRSLILLETSADPEPNGFKYRILNFIARWFGLGLVIDRVMPIMFGSSFLADPAREALRTRWRDAILANDRVGITRAVMGVIERRGVADRISQIDMPVLVLVGDQDAATVPEKSERMHAAIPGSKLVIIPNAGHSSTIEEPEAVNAALTEFLETDAAELADQR